jgi:hypothetical protein
MMKFVLGFALLLCAVYSQAAAVHGRILNERQQPLPYASLFIKGTTTGTTTNAEGEYSLDLPVGSYVLVCQYMGYNRAEKNITVDGNDQTVNFTLTPVSMQIKEVVVKSGGEDPAYAIIRQAIKKRDYYRHQVNEYTCNDYIKGVFKLRGAPDKVLGQKVDKGDLGVDSTGKGVLFLSESMTKVNFKEPDKVKVEVISARQSGGGFGFSFPAFIDLYDNNVQAVITTFAKRGFISPIAENALSYYKYRLEGTFIEDGKTVNKIAVMPKRKYEPLFSGYIFITDGDWHIHSADLLLTQDYQLELMDTLRIRQTHVPVEGDVWRTKDQVIYISVKQLGFDMVGNFVNVYSNYNIHPGFEKKSFDRTILRYDTAYDKKALTYWDSIRPVPLERDELKDFREKDSIARAGRDSAKLAMRIDSLKAHQKPVKVTDFLWKGMKHSYYFMRDSSVHANQLAMKGLLKQLEYNTVEGLVVSVEPSLDISLPHEQSLTIDPFIRYGFSNTHLNAYSFFTWRQESKVKGRIGNNTWMLGGGKRVSQINREAPISALANEVYTLLLKDNYMKVYENWFARFQFTREFDNSMVVTAGLSYEDRIPLENTTDFVIFQNSHKLFTPNHPYELANIPFERDQAFVANIGFTYQPGQRFIELPDRKVPIGSKYPTFNVVYQKGIHGVAGSDADFDKWRFKVFDDMNLKLFGVFKYQVMIGGFLNSTHVDLPDYQHFNGNQTFYNINYLNSFQLAPYYKYSNIAPFYATANVEHHFNGLLTNKVPLLNRLKWNLVVGSNAFYVNRNNNYVEVFAGLENIFKLIRVDVIAGYQSQDNTRIGVRVGFGGLLGGLIKQ